MEIPKELKFKALFELSTQLYLNGRSATPEQAAADANTLFEKALEHAKGSGIIPVNTTGQLRLVP